MNTFLFVWNPKKWKWTTLEENIEELEKTGRILQKWSCISHKAIKVGDRAFLVRLGNAPRGIMGAGFVSTMPFLSKHWNGKDKLVHRVIIDFEVLLNPAEEPILELEILRVGNLRKQTWTPQASGISIKPELIEELEAIWFDFVTTQKIRNNPFKFDEADLQQVYSDGKPNLVVETKYERNPYARKACIDFYGYSCVVCGFNFQNIYGDLGKEFIHVHHLNQVSDIREEHKINPIKDLRPVCPNCHSMIHRNKHPLSIEEITENVKLHANN